MKHRLSAILLLCLGHVAFGQDQEGSEPQYWLDGFARTWFTSNALVNQPEPPVTAGWNLLDLNPHVNPTPNVEVFAQVRVLNEFGGFFGQGTQVDVRQLRVSGVLDGKVRFNVGDIYLNQSRFTLHADDGEVFDPWGRAFEAQRNLVAYENFFEDNRWRLQGAHANAVFLGDRWVERLVLDGYATRPRGSRQLSEASYVPDRVLAGVTSAVTGQDGWSGEFHHSVMADLPQSGTAEHNVLNPVVHGLIHKEGSTPGLHMRWTAEAGASRRGWRMRDVNAPDLDSVAFSVRGGFAGLNLDVTSQDSSWTLQASYREVDPFFRSAGSQSKRYNFAELPAPAVLPTVDAGLTTRPASLFDLLTDVSRANQSLSPTLMAVAPLFDNILPFGHATPNRRGGELAVEKQQDALAMKLDLGMHSELTGQGTTQLRTFKALGLGAEWTSTTTSHLWRVSVFEKLQQTQRGGSALEAIELLTSNLTMSAGFEVWSGTWLEGSGRHAVGRGHEFLALRDGFGALYNFERVELDTQAWMTSLGIKHILAKDISACVQWNAWGQGKTGEGDEVRANQVFIVISARL